MKWATGAGPLGRATLRARSKNKRRRTGGGGNDEREGEEEIGGPDAKLFVGGLAWEIDNEA
eukprot:COSAG01_NODE_6124_length_3838_cov_405.005884_7_plen_60_part_01